CSLRLRAELWCRRNPRRSRRRRVGLRGRLALDLDRAVFRERDQRADRGQLGRDDRPKHARGQREFGDRAIPLTDAHAADVALAEQFLGLVEDHAPFRLDGFPEGLLCLGCPFSRYVTKAGAKTIYQAMRTSDTPWRGRWNDSAARPFVTCVRRDGSSEASCPARSRSRYCCGDGGCGDPMRFHASYALL